MNSTITLPRSVVEQALEALNATMATHGKREWIEAAKQQADATLRSALEQPQVKQEPVAWRWIGRKGWVEYGPIKHDLFGCEPLYLHSQPPRQPLTDAEILMVLDAADIPDLPMDFKDVDIDIARAIEEAHGIKENT